MQKVYIMMGLPATGKSTYAMDLVKKDRNTILLSADGLRQEVLGDIMRQDHNPLIFSMMNEMAVTALRDGKSVVYDATNISEDRRRSLARMLRDRVGRPFMIIGVYCIGDHITSTHRNCKREQQVPVAAIEKMVKNFDIPTKRDCYLDELQYHTIAEVIGESTLSDVIQAATYDEYASIMMFNTIAFNEVADLPQDCPYHTLSTSRHMYEAMVYGRKHMPKELEKYRDVILFALAFHDIGKGVCKQFHRRSKYAHFTGHEKASAQIFLSEIVRHPFFGESESTMMMIAALIKEHGFAYENKGLEAALREIEMVYGTDFMKCLKFMRECDQAAK